MNATHAPKSNFGLVDRYVVGFMFDDSFSIVAMIRKEKPDWQKGLLNGIGGKIEHGEIPSETMVREFAEEAGLNTSPDDWTRFCSMHGTNNDGSQFFVNFYWAKASLAFISRISSMTAEKTETHSVDIICSGREKTVGNVPWLVALALDCARGSYPPSEVAVRYSPR